MSIEQTFLNPDVHVHGRPVTCVLDAAGKIKVGTVRAVLREFDSFSYKFRW